MRVLPVELFQRGGKGGSNRVAEGVPTSKKSTHMGGGGVPTGSRGGFARRVGVPLMGNDDSGKIKLNRNDS